MPSSFILSDMDENERAINISVVDLTVIFYCGSACQKEWLQRFFRIQGMTIDQEWAANLFSFSAPAILNSLPQQIRFPDSLLFAFPSLLKTFLYQKCLPPLCYLHSVSSDFDLSTYNGLSSHHHHQLNVHFLPRLIKGVDGCFPTALGRQSTFSNILGPLI